ncbi:MAG: transglutaminase domain-containing protein [Defluviitaleaceae bacterium]|nr:transglutaminase domain-containing protein [Defluviitaleaceae bacterium]
MKNKTWHDYIFCLIVGGMYLYALNRTIISATHIRMEPVTLYAVGLLSLILFMVVLYNKITRIVTVVLILLITAWVFFTLEDVREQYTHFYELYLMVTGQLGYRWDLGRTTVWIISLLLAFTIVVFMLHQFNFYMLALGGAAAFIFTWAPGFTRDAGAFWFFLVAFCLIMIRKMNKSTTVVLTAVPLCIALVWFVQWQMPTESDMFVRRQFREEDGILTAVGDFFYELFNPVHFSFQSTGFSGAGGRLGGPISPNNRYVMTVVAPGRTYLSGATSNIYTGYRWLPMLSDGEINTHGLSPSEFEKLETTSALIRYATQRDIRTSVPLSQLGSLLEAREIRRVHPSDFPVLGYATYTQYYLHTYIPMATMSVSMGANRTGTVFRPPAMTQFWFDEDSADYSTFAEITPTGDIQMPGFMSRGTTYHMQFLNVQTDLAAIENIMRGTNRGVYDMRAGSFGDWVRGHSGGSVPTPTLEQLLANMLDHELLTFMEGVFRHPEDELYHLLSATLNALSAERQDMVWEHIIYLHESGALRNPLPEPGENFDIAQHGGLVIAQRGGLVAQTDSGSSTVIIRIEAFSNVEPTAAALPPAPLDVEGFAQLVGLYTQSVSSTRRINYIPDMQEFLRLLDSFETEILAEYAREVRRFFSDVPDIVPQRVFDLTFEIIAGLTNDFDRVMAIREYLLQFPYTMDTAPVPRGVCFVDWFLFETQEGYCVYFASAMAIMSRIAGVPSRYVEGFVLPPTANPNEPVTVTNRMAHAWVEVYLEGFGWKIIEATPTYAFLLNPEFPVPTDFQITGDWIDHELQEWLRMMQYGYNPYDAALFGERTAITPPATAAPQDNGHRRTAQIFVLTLALMAALGVLAFIQFRRMKIHSKLRRVKNLPPNQQVITYFNAIMDIISYYTSPPAPDETPQLYGRRMGKRFAFRSDSIFFRDLISVYYKAKYSPAQASLADAEILREAHEDMLKLVQQMRRKISFMYLIYVRRLGEV